MRSGCRLERAVALALVALAGSACGDGERQRPTSERGLVVLAIDGMDPQLLRRFMAEGKTPNLKALSERGGFAELGTTFPPQSPVAWSTVVTGHAPDQHGIFDFVHRDQVTLDPYLSTTRVVPGSTLKIGPVVLPTSSAHVEGQRAGDTFWQLLEDAEVPATVVKVPANFPPAESHTAESVSGMGTPDLLGTYGTFQLFTSDPELAEQAMSGGIVSALDFGDGQRATAPLTGPPNPLDADGDAMTSGLEVVVDRERPVARIQLGGRALVLGVGEWSEWTPVYFDPGVLAGEVSGMVRIYLAEVRPHVRLYVSPINLDPLSPAMPLSGPPSYSRELAEDIGRYYSQGMPLDTKALIAGALSDDDFLEQAAIVYAERLKLLDRELDRFDGGLLFFYVSSVDQLCHVYYRSMDPDAPAHDQRYAHVIPDIYERVDALVGDVIERVGPDVDVMVISDHGFSPYRRKVHLNTWLATRGYLAVHDAADAVGEGALGHIDWERTQAYALGLNQLFVNLQGREAHGSLSPERRELVLRRLTRELLAWRDLETGERVVTDVQRPESGTFPDRAPDLIIGFNREYRSSDESALGEVGDEVIEDNTGKWSGDHCMHPVHVPGVILGTFPITVEEPSLYDIAPTILDYFSVSGADSSLPGAPVYGSRLEQKKN